LGFVANRVFQQYRPKPEVADTSHAKEKAARKRLFNSNLIVCGLRGHPCPALIFIG
jgi:hypothetical protein